jgi:Family of unknown function (DUF5330)
MVDSAGMVNDRLPALRVTGRWQQGSRRITLWRRVIDRVVADRHIVSLNKMTPVWIKFSANSFQIWTKNDSCDEPRLQPVSASVRPSAAGQQQPRTRGRVMKFLVKAAFWLTVVALLLPGDEKRPTAAAPEVGATEAVSAAGAAMSDMRQFCSRQPDACTVGSQATVAFGHKVQAGAKMLYEFLNDRLGPNETGSAATPRPAVGGPAQPSQHTLTPDDLLPAWRGPEPRRDTKRPA